MRGVVIVMNPQTGEILAMVSLPTYDNNVFARGISSADYQALLDDPDRPLLNFAISEQYPPGSTYKLVTGTGALAGRHDQRPRPCSRPRAYLAIGRYKYWDWNQRGFGPLNIYGGFAHSSDTFFYQIAGMLGIDRLGLLGHQFGFGEPTGIDLPGEAGGIVPTNEWKQGVFNQPIYPGEVYQAGIGQGYDMATPLQLLNAYCALANGGTLYRPQIVRRVLAPDGTGRGGLPARGHPQAATSTATCCGSMRLAARRGLTVAPHVQPGRPAARGRPARPAPPSSASVTARAACRSTPGSWPSCPSSATARPRRS